MKYFLFPNFFFCVDLHTEFPRGGCTVSRPELRFAHSGLSTLNSIRSSQVGGHSHTPSCATLTRGYPRLNFGVPMFEIFYISAKLSVFSILA